jgi:pilus assembly protein Flp/PilA
MRQLLLRFLRDTSGATAIEYALIGGLVSVAIIVGARALGVSLNSVYTGVSAKVSEVAGS